MKQTYITRNAQETEELGQHLGRQIIKPMIVALRGELGSGKTTFVKGFAKGLGITQPVTSPTYIIIRQYTLPSQVAKEHLNWFYHIDLYRLQREKDTLAVGLGDIVKEADAIVLVEWPENMGKFLPEKRIDISFVYRADNERKITIQQYE
jgi:tRNA threonylcarbamoyladenosine biosynthesis protein TsaE